MEIVTPVVHRPSRIDCDRAKNQFKVGQGQSKSVRTIKRSRLAIRVNITLSPSSVLRFRKTRNSLMKYSERKESTELVEATCRLQQTLLTLCDRVSIADAIRRQTWFKRFIFFFYSCLVNRSSQRVVSERTVGHGFFSSRSMTRWLVTVVNEKY